MNTVLMTHFLAERSMNAVNIGNELGLLAVGAGNRSASQSLYSGKSALIRMSQRQIEAMKEILWKMAKQLTAGIRKVKDAGSRSRPPLRSASGRLDRNPETGGEKCIRGYGE